jgi:putative membrane protein
MGTPRERRGEGPFSWGVRMMNGYGGCWGWMILMPLVWLGLAGVIVWAVVRLVQRPSDAERPTQHRETPQEILDRRFASGEIDADAYTKARAHLAGRGPDSR